MTACLTTVAALDTAAKGPIIPCSSAAQTCTTADTINFNGTVALIDRGNCNISVKVRNAVGRGALGVVIANNVPGDAPTFSSGGDTPVTQTLIATQDMGSVLRSAPAGSVRVVVDARQGIPLPGSMVASSTRGPGYSFTALKPKIGAPARRFRRCSAAATARKASAAPRARHR